jgi:hypothetical protein
MTDIKPWIGVDLDGTLAHYEHFIDADVIGDPVPSMVARVKRWLAEGKDVRIMTARVWAPNDDPARQHDAAIALEAIQDWCRVYLGVVLPVTAIKDYGMVELWDDRAIQIERNTGRRLDGGA